MMILETTDGVALLGYAGLGTTAEGTEPADWMSAVLRGRNLPLEQSLAVLAKATKDQLPRHLRQIPNSADAMHNIVATAFVGDEPQCYRIDMRLGIDRKNYFFRHTRWITPAGQTPRFGLAGSGAHYLLKNKIRIQPLLRMVRAYDAGKVQAETVADHFAKLNFEVHKHTLDKTVGPRCIVVWRNRKNGIHKDGGGMQHFTSIVRDKGPLSLPNIARGTDIVAVIDVLMPGMLRTLDELRTGKPVSEVNRIEVNEALAKLPEGPDEQLR